MKLTAGNCKSARGQLQTNVQSQNNTVNSAISRLINLEIGYNVYQIKLFPSFVQKISTLINTYLFITFINIYISGFRISGQSLIEENCHNSRTRNDIDMKLGPATKLYKRTPCRQIVTSLLFSRFVANLEQSGSRIPDAWSVKLTFSLIVTFYLTKTENRTKKIFNIALMLLLWVKVLILTKSADFL